MIRKSMCINGRRTSTTLEPEFWDYLAAIAHWRGVPVRHVISCIEAEAPPRDSLASALRVYCLEHARRHAVQMQSTMAVAAE